MKLLSLLGRYLFTALFTWWINGWLFGVTDLERKSVSVFFVLFFTLAWELAAYLWRHRPRREPTTKQQ